MRRSWYVAGAALAVVGLFAGLTPAWWIKGHESITEAAANALPTEVPAFFRAGGKHLAQFVGDPDRWKNRDTPCLRTSEEANHYLDLEELEGKPLPKGSRFKGMDLMRSLNKDPLKVGLLPYAIEEGYERLAVAFSDYRKHPDNESIRMKCLVYGGNLAHYTTDASMPLHTTLNYDGIRQADGSIKQKGIHAKLDGFPEKFKLTPEEICRGLEAKPVTDVWSHILEFIKASHAEVDKCYEFDAAGAFETPTDASRAFVLGRCRAGAQFTADIWLSAWKLSEKLPNPY
ncbi:MAG TPA: hypothetical protein VGJ05_15645 [Fimbriiglobus sp.]|jgi:hypothetical protein